MTVEKNYAPMRTLQVPRGDDTDTSFCSDSDEQYGNRRRDSNCSSSAGSFLFAAKAHDLHLVAAKADINVRATGFSDLSDPKTIRNVCSKLVQGWHVLNAEKDIVVRQIMAGLTNQLFQVSIRPGIAAPDTFRHTTVLFRVYGKDVSDLYDTHFELKVYRALSKRGIAPHSVAHFPGGRIEEWILGPALLVKDMTNPSVLCGMATLLGRFHALHSRERPFQILPSPPAACFKMLTRWRRKALEVFERALTSEDSDPTYVSKLKALGLEAIAKESEKLGDLLHPKSRKETTIDSALVFCHNDCQENNVLVTDSCLRLIDFEYSDYNYAAYDIANYFFESTCDYCVDSSPFFQMNEANYPNEELRRLFAAVYLSEQTKEVVLPSHDDIIVPFTEAVERFTLASDLVWGFWSVIRAPQAPTVFDFDFLGYAKARFDHYHKKLQTLVSLGITELP